MMRSREPSGSRKYTRPLCLVTSQPEGTAREKPLRSRYRSKPAGSVAEPPTVGRGDGGEDGGGGGGWGGGGGSGGGFDGLVLLDDPVTDGCVDRVVSVAGCPSSRSRFSFHVSAPQPSPPAASSAIATAPGRIARRRPGLGTARTGPGRYMGSSLVRSPSPPSPP